MALNCGLAAARGEIVVLSDGDVVIGAGRAAAPPGAFHRRYGRRHDWPSGERQPAGHHAGLLVASADRQRHRVRLKRDRAGQFLLCSGYLFAFRRALIGDIPIDALAEDAVISHEIAQAGYRIRYVPEAQVSVRYPTTYRDWLRQKVRSAGGYAQEYIRKSPFSMRSAQREIVDGTRLALAYPRNLRELAWTLLLFAARLHLWLLVFWNVPCAAASAESAVAAGGDDQMMTSDRLPRRQEALASEDECPSAKPHEGTQRGAFVALRVPSWAERFFELRWTG